MQFQNLVKDVRLYIRLEGAEVESRIKSFINDACLRFARLAEFRHLIQSATLTTDNSGSYDISDIVPEPFVSDMMLLVQGTTPSEKVDYLDYIQSGSPSGQWTIFGGQLHVAGTGSDFTFIYTSTGSPYPMVEPTDENVAATYYPDIIKQIAIVRYLNYLGDLDASSIEFSELNKLIAELKKSENRAQKEGRTLRVSTHNR